MNEERNNDIEAKTVVVAFEFQSPKMSYRGYQDLNPRVGNTVSPHGIHGNRVFQYAVEVDVRGENICKGQCGRGRI